MGAPKVVAVAVLWAVGGGFTMGVGSLAVVPTGDGIGGFESFGAEAGMHRIESEAKEGNGPAREVEIAGESLRAQVPPSGVGGDDAKSDVEGAELPGLNFRAGDDSDARSLFQSIKNAISRAFSALGRLFTRLSAKSSAAATSWAAAPSRRLPEFPTGQEAVSDFSDSTSATTSAESIDSLTQVSSEASGDDLGDNSQDSKEAAAPSRTPATPSTGPFENSRADSKGPADDSLGGDSVAVPVSDFGGGQLDLCDVNNAAVNDSAAAETFESAGGDFQGSVDSLEASKVAGESAAANSLAEYSEAGLNETRRKRAAAPSRRFQRDHTAMSGDSLGETSVPINRLAAPRVSEKVAAVPQMAGGEEMDAATQPHKCQGATPGAPSAEPLLRLNYSSSVASSLCTSFENSFGDKHAGGNYTTTPEGAKTSSDLPTTRRTSTNVTTTTASTSSAKLEANLATGTLENSGQSPNDQMVEEAPENRNLRAKRSRAKSKRSKSKAARAAKAEKKRLEKERKRAKKRAKKEARKRAQAAKSKAAEEQREEKTPSESKGEAPSETFASESADNEAISSSTSASEADISTTEDPLEDSKGTASTESAAEDDKDDEEAKAKKEEKRAKRVKKMTKKRSKALRKHAAASEHDPKESENESGDSSTTSTGSSASDGDGVTGRRECTTVCRYVKAP